MQSKLLALILSLAIVSPSWGAMDFDGTDDYFAASVPTVSAPWSVSLWTYKRSAGSSGFGAFFSENTNSLGFGSDASAGEFFAASEYFDSAISPSVTNRWVHRVYVLDGTDIRLYADGLLFGSKPKSGLSSFTSVNIGWWVSYALFHADALIDDIRLYNRALSASEIESIAKSRSRLNITDGLVGWWKLDEGTDGATASGTGSVIDSSGNGNHGTPTNGPVWRASSWINYP